MRVETFTIDYPKNKASWCKRFGLNAYYSGKHWATRKKDADYMHQIVTAALYRQEIPKKPFSRPVSITFWHNDRMDVDNHAAIEKMVVDALKGWLLEDDSRKQYVKKTTLFHDAEYIRIEVREA